MGAGMAQLTPQRFTATLAVAYNNKSRPRVLVVPNPRTVP
jgi:hypothetical protein